MTDEKTLKVLEEYQKWRRGEPPYDPKDDLAENKTMPYSPKEVGEAIDAAIRALGGGKALRSTAQA